MDELLENVKTDPESVDFSAMVNIVIVHCQSEGKYNSRFARFSDRKT